MTPLLVQTIKSILQIVTFGRLHCIHTEHISSLAVVGISEFMREGVPLGSHILQIPSLDEVRTEPNVCLIDLTSAL